MTGISLDMCTQSDAAVLSVDSSRSSLLSPTPASSSAFLPPFEPVHAIIMLSRQKLPDLPTLAGIHPGAAVRRYLLQVLRGTKVQYVALADPPIVFGSNNLSPVLSTRRTRGP